MPVEAHMVAGVPIDDMPSWCTATPPCFPEKMQGAAYQLCEMALTCLCHFICALDARRARQLTLPGIKVMRKPTKKKRRKYEFYEHSLITIDPHAPLPAHGDGFGSGRKHRLHPVRGFWRTYRKTGKRVWIKAHWRGDKDLGVITHDYEVTDNETTQRDD